MDDQRYEQWLEAHYRAYHTSLYRHLLYVTGGTTEHSHMIEDCIQEAYLRVWIRRSKYFTYDNLDGLLLVVARNVLTDKLRAASVRNRPHTRIVTPNPRADALRHEADTETLRTVREAIAREDFELLLRYYDSRDARKKLARDLGKNQKTVQVRVSRLIRKLRNMLTCFF